MNDGRKQAEDTLQESFSLLYTVIQATKDAMIAITEEGLISIFNPAAEEMFGRTREEMLGQPLDCLMPEEYREQHRVYVTSYFATGQPRGAMGRVLELPGLRRDGTVFPMEISLSAGKYGRVKRRQFVIAIARDITERRRTEEEQRAQLDRVRRQQAAIVKLATHDAVVAGDFERAARVITEVAGEAMEVERVGIWLLSKDHRQLRCADLFERSRGTHTAGTVLETNEYPRYFEALKAGRGINSADARTDPRTSEFTDGYLVPLGISSMLDAPIRLRGQIIGVICHEHVGPCRAWQTDEIAFAGEVADQVAQVLMNREGKRAEEALRESEERYRAVAEFASDCIYWRSPDGDILYISPACVELTGYTPHEFRASPGLFETIVHPDDRHRWENHEHAALADGAPQALEFRIVTKQGRTRWINHVCRPVYDDAGTFLGVRGSNRDITDRKQVEEELRESDERFKQVAENAQEWIWEVDANGLYTYASPIVGQILGYEPEELVGNKHFYDLFHPEDREELKKVAFEVFGKKESFREFINRNIDRNGNTVWLSTSGVPLLDAKGNLVGYRGADTNITERKQAEEERGRLEDQIRDARKLESLGVLAAGIARDFNNLLVGVFGYTSLAKQELPAESPARNSIQRIENVAHQAEDLTKQLLAYAGEGRFVVAPLDLSALVREMAHLLATSISKKAVLKYDLAENLPAIQADSTQVRQLVMNLITNASDAIGEKTGVITVATGVVEADRAYLAEAHLGRDLPTGHYVYVEVSDTGCGMDEETKASVFDPFFTTKFIGRGLGLAAVLGIVRGHGGAIKIDSEPGRGSTFRVLFPCSEQLVFP